MKVESEPEQYSHCHIGFVFSVKEIRLHGPLHSLGPCITRFQTESDTFTVQINAYPDID